MIAKTDEARDDALVVRSRGYINILRIQGRASPPNEPASHPHIAGDISAFSRSPGHNLDETRRESYSCGQPDRIENCIVAFRIEQQRWFFLKSHGG